MSPCIPDFNVWISKVRYRGKCSRQPVGCVTSFLVRPRFICLVCEIVRTDIAELTPQNLFTNRCNDFSVGEQSSLLSWWKFCTREFVLNYNLVLRSQVRIFSLRSQ